MSRAEFGRRYFEDPNFPAGLKGGDEVKGYGYYPDYFPIVEAQLSSLVELTGGESLIDVGCGKGALAEYARLDMGLRVAAVDGSAYAVTHAHRRDGGAWTVQAACDALPFPDAAFDLGWSNGVLQYTPAAEAAAALGAIARVTRTAVFVSNIAAAQRQTEWGRRDTLTKLYLRPAEWATIAAGVMGAGLRVSALPFEGESAILVYRPELTGGAFAMRFVELSLERMQRLGALRRQPPGLDGFYRREQAGQKRAPL